MTQLCVIMTHGHTYEGLTNILLCPIPSAFTSGHGQLCVIMTRYDSHVTHYDSHMTQSCVIMTHGHTYESLTNMVSTAANKRRMSQLMGLPMKAVLTLYVVCMIANKIFEWFSDS